jgi:propanol-preferring alcohol dehydrogenase
MKAWLFTGAHEPLKLIEREDPKPGPDQVVVDVCAAGLCHSDVGFLDGTLTGLLRRLPMILGHEVAGTVSRVGDGVKDYQIGDRVVLAGPEDFAASTVGFDAIPASLERLRQGGVVGRLVALP